MATRMAVFCLTAWLAACSDDTGVGSGPGSADAFGAPDLVVMELALDSAADEPVDVALDVSATTVVGLPAWLTGTWLECSGTLTITAPDQASWTPTGQTCAITAQLVYHDGGLDFTGTHGGKCAGGPPSWFTKGTHVAFDGQELAIIAAKLFTGMKRFSHVATRESWDFTSGTGGIGTMRLCFDQNGQFYDGFWVSSNCTLIACGAIVAQVKHVDAETHIWTECQGSCPCTSIVIATQKSAAAMSGKYSGGDCHQGDSGVFTAVSTVFPD